MADNKVRFGLKNVHYAFLTETAGVPSWGTPKAVPGAVNLELSAEGTTVNFNADNQLYYRDDVSNGYTGSLEMAKIPDTMLVDVFGFVLDNTSKVVAESADTTPKPFALLFQIDGDAANECYVFYKCYAGRPNVGSGTISPENGREPQTQTIGLTAVAVRDVTASSTVDGMIQRHTNADTTATVKNGWFTSVYTG